MATIKNSEYLFFLIKSLSKSEKRFFKLSSQFQNGEKVYLNVFNAIDKMHEYNEEILLTKIPGDKTLAEKKRKLSVTKNYLYNLILKCLRTYNEKESIDVQLYNMIMDVEILKAKGLFQPALKRLGQAKKLAVEHEKLLALIEIIDLKIYITMGRRNNKVKETVDMLYAEADDALTSLQQQLLLKQLNKELFLATKLRSKAVEQEAIQKVEDLLPSEEHIMDLDSFYAKNHYYHVLASYYQIKKDPQKSYEYRFNIIELWRNNPIIKKARRYKYTIILSNYLQAGHRFGKYDAFPEILKEIESLPGKSQSQAAETFQNVRFLELLYYMNDNKFHKAVELVPIIEKGLKKYRKEINKGRQVAFYYNITILFFALERYKEASIWLNKILYDEKSDPREDIKRFSWILEVVLHFKMGNDRVLQHIFSSSSIPIKKGTPNAFESLAFKHLRKISNKPVMKKALFKEFRTDLDHLKSEERHFGMEELSIWVESNIRNRTFVEVMRERA